MFGLCSQDIPEYDVVIVGTGIVGLATAQELIQRYPKLTFAVIDKENHVGKFVINGISSIW